MHTSKLFEPLSLRSVTLRNRIGVSPMCQYSCDDGFPTDWHLVHLGSRAVGGAGLVMVEATAVAAEGRISPSDAGIWKDEHTAAWKRIAEFIAAQGAVPAMQLAHAGWKASTDAPWLGGKAVSPERGGWQPVGVGNKPFAADYPTPRQLTVAELDALCAAWQSATRRALAAGFKLIEVHAAHGYLFHSFLSPVSNTRTDEYGGSFENRTRLLLRVVKEVRGIVPKELPLAVRLSCSDWIDGGWTIDDSVRLSKELREFGVDLIDCSSGGISPTAKIPVGPGYQTAFAAHIRQQAHVPTASVGMITEAHQAETILRTEQADVVLLARELLRDPYWPRTAAAALGDKPEGWTPTQYARAW
ncbi:NADH:flavin oxidoreductase/NADH oxidase [Limnoglobus roseus]|uniref:NADH:flavin oxidoreductase/NADH oxidase n=1 Tax=Limnoglobus roseus TaxID=2598579 RepID=A0A5C1AQD9_9BACT|nr:NADH:flavin oxidoreductase/NADH oxidase [Limnoglobus roseus]QEL20835.1 NADH:flavin oxidoreductase/NADH oxidase [Limnoglobus roseus]